MAATAAPPMDGWVADLAPALTAGCRAVVKDEWIDYNGHMNVKWPFRNDFFSHRTFRM